MYEDSVQDRSISQQIMLPPSFNPWVTEYKSKILFIGGLPLDCTYIELYQFLIQYSDILWMRIDVDPGSGISRGCGSCILTGEQGRISILKAKDHYIRGALIGVQPWKEPRQYKAQKILELNRKVFVKRIVPILSEGVLKTYFSQFGQVEFIDIKKQQIEINRNGFCFVVFSTEKETSKCLQNRFHFIQGNKVVCSKCRERESFPKALQVETRPLLKKKNLLSPFEEMSNICDLLLNEQKRVKQSSRPLKIIKDESVIDDFVNNTDDRTKDFRLTPPELDSFFLQRSSSLNLDSKDDTSPLLSSQDENYKVNNNGINFIIKAAIDKLIEDEYEY